MNRTTIFGALLVATVVATGMLAATAVGGSTTSAAAPSGTVTLSGWASSPAETKLLRQTIASFEKAHPRIKVRYAPISGDYPTAMLSRFAARNPPDVFYVDSNVIPDWINPTSRPRKG